jgi:hypothetical protein
MVKLRIGLWLHSQQRDSAIIGVVIIREVALIVGFQTSFLHKKIRSTRSKNICRYSSLDLNPYKNNYWFSWCLQLFNLPETKERKLQSVLHSNIRNTERSQLQGTLDTLQSQLRRVLCNICLLVLVASCFESATMCRLTMQLQPSEWSMESRGFGLLHTSRNGS